MKCKCNYAMQEYFERALELPGTGLKRWRDKPPALSTGELTVRVKCLSGLLCTGTCGRWVSFCTGAARAVHRQS